MTTTTLNKLGKFTVETYPARTLAYVRNVGPYQGDTALFKRLYEQVMAWAGPKGFMSRAEMEGISLYHDDPKSVPVDQQRISVGITVPAGTTGEGDIQIMEIPAGKFAVGSFEILPNQYPEAWTETMKYMAEEGLAPAGIMYESGKNDPEKHPEGKHIVDICISLG